MSDKETIQMFSFTSESLHNRLRVFLVPLEATSVLTGNVCSRVTSQVLPLAPAQMELPCIISCSEITLNYTRLSINQEGNFLFKYKKKQ